MRSPRAHSAEMDLLLSHRELGAFDALFEQLTARADGGAEGSGGRRANGALTRQQFLQVLLHAGATRFLAMGQDESGGLLGAMRLTFEAIRRNAIPQALHVPNEFRRNVCYTEASDAALRAHEALLKPLFDAFSTPHRAAGAKSRRLMSFGEWMAFVQARRARERHRSTPPSRS